MEIKPIKWNGKRITKPGLYSHVPIDTYHQPDICDGPSASGSMLRDIVTKSPAHMFATWRGNPKADEPEEKAHFTLGRAAHHLVLGEDHFSTYFVVRDERVWSDWRTNAAKEWREKQWKAGYDVLTLKDMETIGGIAESLNKLPLIKEGKILEGLIEQSFFWRDQRTGIWLKNRPDAVPTGSADVADLKTTSFYGEKLRREVFNLRYDLGAALTKWAFKVVLDMDIATYSLVFVEKKKPHCAEVLSLRPESIESAEVDLRVAIDVFAHCLKTGDWFGPSGSQYDAVYLTEPERHREYSDKRTEFLMREITPAERR